MLTDQGHVKVMDFGLAKRVEDLPSPDQATCELVAAQLTARGSIVGTPDYMSPEQVKGVALDARSDLFSLGVILAEMISGRHPFRQPSTGETLSAVLRESPDLSGDIPPGLMDLIRRLLAKPPRIVTRQPQMFAPSWPGWPRRHEPSSRRPPRTVRPPRGSGWHGARPRSVWGSWAT
jgi:serine/threonine protein kinase